MSRRSLPAVLAALAALASALVLLPGPPAQAVTDRWAAWGAITGRSNDYATTMQQRSPGFPRAVVASDSRGNVQLAAGGATFLGPATPPGTKYGSSQGSPYLVLRPRADTPQGASTTTYTFDAPTPDTGWAFVLGDVDSDQVRVRATGEDGTPVPAAEVDSWFVSSFNYAGGTDLPAWDDATSTLVGNTGALDTEGAAGWFEPDVRLTSLTFVFTRRAGFPVYQTWFVSRARPIGGVVDDVSDDPDTCPITDAVLTLVSPYGEQLGVTSPAADGSYDFGELATQAGYVVRIDAPPSCAVVGPAQATVSNRGNDGDPDSRADFALREIVPQPISGTVRDGPLLTDAPVPGVAVTLDRPDGTSVTLTTGPDGSYLFDENEVGTGYTLTLTVPPGYAPGPDGTEIDGIEVDDIPITGQDFEVRLLPAVTGTVTGGGNPLGGVPVTLAPDGGGPSFTTATTGDGGYSLAGIPAGDYTVSIDAPPGYGGTTSRPLTVAADDVQADFALTRPGAVGGTVTDADSGDPVPGVEIAVDGPGPATTVDTDQDGRYFVDGLDAGDYAVAPVPPAGTEVVGPDSRSATVTPAGEIRGAVDFRLAEVDAPPTPTPTPTPTPSPGPTDSPTEGPAGTGPGTSAPGSGLPDTGGPSGWLAASGLALVLAGVALVLAGRRRSSG